jgi:glucans biosynthesis protein
MSIASDAFPILPRRGMMLAAAALAAALVGLRPARSAGTDASALQHSGQHSGHPFDFDRLTETMRQRAAAPFAAPEPIGGPLAGLGHDDYRRIRFRPDRRRVVGEGFELAAFPSGWIFREPVGLFLVAGGRAEPLVFTPDDFEFPGDLASRLAPPGELPGVAGFRLHHALNRPDVMDELVAFIGASNFRALGRGSVYGISARGLALNTATGRAEEFPRFTRFYLEPGPGSVTIHAALESESVAGALRFVVRPGATTVMEVTCRLFFREAVAELGVAPLTSMFLFAENSRARFDDFRPSVHNSDGLRIIEADGDVIWRPLNNPARLAGGYFAQTAPVRFGLHQRDRRFESFQDGEALYHRRPSLDVEPLGDWGAGHVRLIEIPSDSEANDNIVAYWVPEAPVVAGEARQFAYRLHWGDLDLDPDAALAHVLATRAGHGGPPDAGGDEGQRRFVVDFQGGMLDRIGAGAAVEAVVGVAGGALVTRALAWLAEPRVWRLTLDVAAEPGAIVEMQAHLAGYGRKLSEIWLNQWVNPS